MEEGDELVAKLNNGGPNGPHPKIAAKFDYNWWQTFDNFMDPFHVVITHSAMNGVQFAPSLGVLPEVRFEYVEDGDGVRNIQLRKLEGKVHQRIGELILPNIHFTAGVSDDDLSQAAIGWLVPQDDTSFRHYRVYRISKEVNQLANYAKLGMLQDDWGPSHGKPFLEWSLEDHQRWQTDYVTQKGQGDINLHSEERLSSIDAGLSMMRRLFKKQAALVAEGKDPIGAGAGVERRIRSKAGNAWLDEESMARIAGYDGR